MKYTLPNGKIINGIPDGTEESEIRQKAIKAGLAKAEDFHSGYTPVRTALQGATLGWGDEAQSLIGAGYASLVDGKKGFWNYYDESQKSLKSERDAYSEQNPKTALALEVGGGVATGGALGAKALGSSALKNVPKWLSTAGIGAIEGAIYNSGSANKGERLGEGAKGAAIGAVAAPIVGGTVQKIGEFGSNVTKYIAEKLTDTPKRQAVRAIRDIMETTGLSVDDAIDRYKSLGKEGALADIDENFRWLTRGAVDNFGPAKGAARDFVEERQLGQIDRLIDKAQQTIGADADKLKTTIKTLSKDRSTKAKPLYDQAFSAAQPTKEMLNLANTSNSMKRAMRRASKIASDEGEPVDSLFKQYHYAKMQLDRDIERLYSSGQRSEGRAVLNVKNRLLALMDEASPEYKKARDLYAGDSALLDAAKQGQKIMKMSADDVDEVVAAMSGSEKELFRLGAVKSIVDTLEDTQLTHDAARKLVNKKSLQRKLGHLFDSESNALDFIRQAASEREFGRTRQVLSQGSPTMERYMSQKGMDEAIQGAGAFASGDPVSAGIALISKAFGKKPITPDVVQEMSSILLDQGLSENQIREVLTRVNFTNLNSGTVGNIIGGATVPAIEAGN